MTIRSGPVPASPAIYRGMTREQLDAAYNNLAAVPDGNARRARWAEQSARLRAESGSVLDIAYGMRARNRLDYFPAGESGAPLFVFIHGGYWQRNDKETFAFVAEGPRAHGIDVALIGYTLAPDATLSEIVEEVGRAMSFLADETSDFSFDRERAFVGGWSAGGHLTAILSDHPAVRGGLAISGIFDLEPIALSYLNEKLQLTRDEIERLSPLLNLSGRSAPLRLAVGGNELPELRRQSEAFATAARGRDLEVRLTVLPGHNHFSILDEIAPDGALTQELRQLIASAT